MLSSRMIFCATDFLILVEKDYLPTASVYFHWSTFPMYIRPGCANLTFVIAITHRASLYLRVLIKYKAIYNKSETNPNLAASFSM